MQGNQLVVITASRGSSLIKMVILSNCSRLTKLVTCTEFCDRVMWFGKRKKA